MCKLRKVIFLLGNSIYFPKKSNKRAGHVAQSPASQTWGPMFNPQYSQKKKKKKKKYNNLHNTIYTYVPQKDGKIYT